MFMNHFIVSKSIAVITTPEIAIKQKQITTDHLDCDLFFDMFILICIYSHLSIHTELNLLSDI